MYIPSDGLSDGGEPYTDEELDLMNKAPELIMFGPDKESNRAALALGVVGIHCTYCGKPETEDLAHGIHLFDLYVSCVERYANGAKNLFLRMVSNPDKPAIGFIRVRQQ